MIKICIANISSFIHQFTKNIFPDAVALKKKYFHQLIDQPQQNIILPNGRKKISFEKYVTILNSSVMRRLDDKRSII